LLTLVNINTAVHC